MVRLQRQGAALVLAAAWAVGQAGVLRAGVAGATKPADLPARDYHIQTTLVRAGKPEVVVVSSSRRPTYAEVARRVQARIKALTGVEVEVLDAGRTSTTDALSSENVIVLGNLATSAFIEKLYYQWYTLLDLWYPGPGGYVVRTLHDPHGTGWNVIFLGGSDDQGVAQAAEVFCNLLVSGDPLEVGWLAEIKLGDGHRMPPQGEWADPRLRIFRADPAPSFGYSDASRAGLIYFYNGDEQAVSRFKDAVLHTDVLTATDHYHAHMHAIVWDLIEESPLFSDEDRRQITARLLVHARGIEGTAGVGKLVNYPVATRLLDRHTSMQAICTLAESRYFGKHWPAEEWDKNLEAVRRYFDRQMTTGKGDSDLGGRGIYMYLECGLIPAIMLGDKRFADSGALRHFADLCLMHCDNTGYMPNSGQNSYDSYPTATLSKCAVLLNDGCLLATMKRREEAERIGGFSDITMEFAPGQAWAMGLEPRPMEKMVGVYYLPLTTLEHEIRVKSLSQSPEIRPAGSRSHTGLGIGSKSVPIERSFDKLTMRTGFDRDDQYLLLDGLHGGPDEKPWPDVNSIVHFGQNGRAFLVSDIGGENPVNHNVVTVSREGFGEPAGRAASLEAVANLPSFGYSHSRAAKHTFSQWDRHIFWRKGHWLMVLDRLAVRDEGRYTLECQWRTIGEPKVDGSDYTSTVREWAEPNSPRDVLNIKNADGLPLRFSEQFLGSLGPPDTKAWAPYCRRKGINRVRQVASRRMSPGDEQVFTNLIYVGGDRTKAEYRIAKLSDHVAVLTGDESAYVGLAEGGRFSRGALSISGAAFCASPKSISVVAGTRLACGSEMIEASEPCNFEIDLASGRVTAEASRPVTVRINGTAHECTVGVHSWPPVARSPDVVAVLASQIEQDAAGVSSAKPGAQPSSSQPVMAAAWTFEAGAEVVALHAGDVDGDGQVETLVGLTDGRAICLDVRGKPRWTYRCGGIVRALAHARLTAGPAVLLGCDDEQVVAISSDGARVLWKHRCYMPPERLKNFPWWTTAGKSRVQAILVDDLDGDGYPDILCGTGGGCVEELSEAGVPQWTTPIEWGIPDRFAVVGMPNGTKTLLVDNSYSSCGSTTWRLSSKGKLLSANAFDTGRSSWDMTAVPSLVVSDLDGDGKPEAIVGRKGAYNEVGLYDAVTGRRKWVQTLSDEVSAVEVIDVNGDGVREVVAGSPSTWLTVFGIDGKRIWAAEMPHEITAIAAGLGDLLVACADAAVYRVDKQGRIQARYQLAGVPLRHFVRAGDHWVIGDSGGRVTALPVRP